MLDVPRLKLTTPVIEGDDDSTLQRAVGHLPDTPFPWQDGNSAIAGHRDGLFRPLKDIKVGDEIRFRTSRDQFRYRVVETSIVQPDDVSVLRRALASIADPDYLLSVLLRRKRAQAIHHPRRTALTALVLSERFRPVFGLKSESKVRIVSGSG